MSSRIKLEELGTELSKIVEEYTEEVSKAIEKEVDSTAKKMRSEVKTTAPKKTGKYAEGFSVKKDDSLGVTSRIIYNRTKPGLVHLLELGHSMRGGGRVSARPHLRPTYDKLVPQMEKNIENIIKKGGK